MKELSRLLLIGVASNLDNLAVGVVLGMRKIAIPARSNLVMAGIAFLFSLVSVLGGAALGRVMPEHRANLVGAILIMAIGVWMIPACQGLLMRVLAPLLRLSLFSMLAAPELADRDRSGVITFGEAMVLGVAVSLNCLTNGVTAGLWKMDVWLMALCNAVLSYVSIVGGVALGRRSSGHWMGAHSALVAGVLLILIGVGQLLGL